MSAPFDQIHDARTSRRRIDVCHSLTYSYRAVLALDENIHWFCPRYGADDGTVYFDEDASTTSINEPEIDRTKRQTHIKEAQSRSAHVLDAFQILAYNSEDAHPFQEKLKRALGRQLTRCDICVREFHRSRVLLKTTLEGQYATEDVESFMEKFDDTNISRICAGLKTATEMLLDLPPDQRNIAAAGTEGMYALFEALNCPSFLEREETLKRYFDKPFQLVQTRRKIKLPSYSPGMTSFLYSHQPERSQWAYKNFAGIKRPVAGSEFEYSIKPFLESGLARVHISYIDEHFIPTFWHATRLILSKLSKPVITNHLRAMDANIYTISLEHFQLPLPHFEDLLESYKILLQISPVDFWDAMGAISPQSVLDTIFRAPGFEPLMTTTNEREPLELELKMAWMEPFLASIKPTNLVPPTRTMLDQLLKRFQAEKYSRYARNVTWALGLRCLLTALELLRNNVRGGPVVTHLLQLVGKEHIQAIMQDLEGIEQKDEMRIDPSEELCMQILGTSLALDCQSLAADRAAIVQTKALDHELSVSGLEIWKVSMRSIKPGHPSLAACLIAGVQGLLGLDRLAKRQIEAAPKAAQFWNTALDRMLTYTTDDLLERLQAFGPDQLVELFQEQHATSGVVALLFSGESHVHESILGLFKTMSGEDSRRDSLMHVVKHFFKPTFTGVVTALGTIARAKVLGPCSTLLRVGRDLFDCLCDDTDGVLRSGRSFDDRELRALEDYWKWTWIDLNVVFEQTEAWSNLGYEKNMMHQFCRATMDFADYVFDQYSLIASVIKDASHDSADDVRRGLLEVPRKTFTNVAKWLRLRDEYLIAKAVDLTCKMLSRLEEVGIEISSDAASTVENMLAGRVKTKLSANQKAEIQRALERHLGDVSADVSELNAPARPKQSSLQGWASSGPHGGRGMVSSDAARTKKGEVIDVQAWSDAAKRRKDFAAETDREMDKLMKSVTSTSTQYGKRRGLPVKSAPGHGPVKAAQMQQEEKKMNEFRLKRQREKEESERRKAEALARANGVRVGVGSGVSGLGNLGKDHSMKGQGVMVSSDDESDEDDDQDEDLFGPKLVKERKTKIRMPDVDPHGAVGLKPEQKKAPTRIHRTQRSLKDMRARLAPDLQPLHRVMLTWEFFHDGDFPPGSNEYQFREVANAFTDPTTYQETFQPLLTLEAWQGMVKSREENTSKPYEIKVLNRSNVDAFIEISSSVSQNENKELQLQEGDIILLSRAKKPTEAPDSPHCLARIYRTKRQKGHLETVYQLMPGNSLASFLTTQAVVYGIKIQSIIPLEREYGALQGLQYFDLCQQIIKARPSNRINSSEKQIAAYQDVWNVNRAQSEAINAALENEGFSLIQGPPGSGKTKTIVAIVGGLLSGTLGATNTATKVNVPGTHGARGNGDAAPKKLLVCAPSNAAVDELVMRLKEGVKTKGGRHFPLNVVRIGRSDAINTQVLDVTMDELVAKRLGGSADDPTARAKTQELFKQHESISAELRSLYERQNSGEVKGAEAGSLQEQIVAVRKRKNELGMRIDNAKDQERNAGREAELDRKKARQFVLDQAHVICATLSGSGHDMFQSLNIEFETVVIDEAAQCVEMSSLIPLKYGCVKCVLVGDPKQLPPTVFSKEAARFQYEQSLFVRMQNNFPGEVHLLDTQYRMHPEISVFPSRTFYDGLLKDGQGMAGLRARPWHASTCLAPYRFFDVHGQHQAAPKGHSLINLAEIEVAMALYARLRTDFNNYDFRGRIGVITPYKSQLKALKDRFSTRFGKDVVDTVEFNTTDAFQGRESEVIIFSCVRASPAGGIGFLQDIRRMNVGLTRAKSSLWVLGNSDSLARGEYWRKLVEDARARECYMTGDVLGMLCKPSSAFPAAGRKDASMFDVNTHVSQMGGQKAGPGTGKSESGRPSAITPVAVTDGSRMEGITVRFEDRIKNKRPAPDGGKATAARPRLKQSTGIDEDVEMADADGGGRGHAAQLGRGGSESRDEGAKSSKDKAPVQANGSAAPKPSSVEAVAPQPPAPRRRASPDPFIRRPRR